MKKYLVVGNPIAHSLSPRLHNSWLKENSINAKYEKTKLDIDEIENLINESMLSALRDNRESISLNDLENVLNKSLVGWKETESIFSTDMIKRISVHEIGHALSGLLMKDHAKLSRVYLNNLSHI